MVAKTILLNAIFLSSAFAAAVSKRDNILAKRVDGTCTIGKDGGVYWDYTIDVPGEGHEGCGGGFLDNLHGQSLTISNFACAPYGDDDVGRVTFQTTVGTNTQVNAAFQAAYGGTGGC